MKKRKRRSVKLNRLVEEASASIKRRARPTQPVKRAQSESSLSQPSSVTTFKLKFPPKRPPPRPHKAFFQEGNAPEAANTGQEDDNRDVEKGRNSELSGVDPNKNMGEHGHLRTESTAPTAENMGTPSSPKHESESEKKDKERSTATTTSTDPDCEKDRASLLSSSKIEVARSAPRIDSLSQPLKFAPKSTSRLCKKKASIPEKVQNAEQEKGKPGI